MLKYILILTLFASPLSAQIPSTIGWYDIPNSKIRPLCPTYPEVGGGANCPNIIAAWGGGLMDTQRNRLIIWGGGHSDYSGNEVYGFDLNTLSWTLVHDTTHGANLTAPLSCAESNADGTPNSRHTYSGLVYEANVDRYLMMGNALATCGGVTTRTWIYDPNANAWSNPTSIGGNEPQTIAWNPTTNSPYFMGHNSGVYAQYNGLPGHNTWATLNPFILTCADSQPQTAAIDDSRQFYYCVGSGHMAKSLISSPFTKTDLTSTSTGCSVPMNAPGPGVAYDPVYHTLVMWVGGNTVYVYNPNTNTCTPNTFPNGPGSQQANGTYGRFQYSPASGTFIVVNSVDQDVFSIRLEVPSTRANQDWINASTTSGVVAAKTWSNPSDFSLTSGCGGYNTGFYPAGDNSLRAFQDTSITFTGNGSLRFDIPANVNTTNPSGYWLQQLGAPCGATGFSAGQTLYFRFSYRMTPNLLQDIWGGGHKAFIIYGPIPGPSCTGFQFVQENTNARNILDGYVSCSAPKLTDSQSTPFNFQQPDSITGTGYTCPFISPWVPAATCFQLLGNTWMTEYWKVTIGTGAANSSSFQAWVAINGQPWREFITLTPFNQAWGDPTNKLQAMILQDYFTGNIPGSNPAASVWYDGLIISTSPIPAPQMTLGTVSTSSGAIATFTPSSITFSTIKAGLSSPPVAVTLQNTGTGTLQISSISISGTNLGDFSQNNNCPSTLAINSTCTINITFSPITIGTRNATLSMVDNTTNGLDTLALSGVGFNPIQGTGTISGSGTIKIQP